MDWTKRVGELHRLAHDYHESQPAMVENYESPEAYAIAMTAYICVQTPLDDDEMRVVLNEMERIVGIE